jgi:hypothetical protein
MSWVKIDDKFGLHPKIIALSDAAFRAHVLALCYCASNRTDGFISLAAARLFASVRVIRELTGAGLWHMEENGGYTLHDYLAYNPSKAEAEATAKAKAIAGAKGAAKRWNGKADSKAVAVPVPQPVSPNGGAKPLRVGDNRPDSDQRYLDEQIADRWKQPEIGFAGLQKLNNEYGRPAVTAALRSLHGFPPATLGRAYGYVVKVCREQAIA